MRDIREELEERVRALELQIGGINAFFEQQVERLKKERDSKLTELKNEIEAVSRVLNFERQRAGLPTHVGKALAALSGDHGNSHFS